MLRTHILHQIARPISTENPTNHPPTGRFPLGSPRQRHDLRLLGGSRGMKHQGHLFTSVMVLVEGKQTKNIQDVWRYHEVGKCSETTFRLSWFRAQGRVYTGPLTAKFKEPTQNSRWDCILQQRSKKECIAFDTLHNNLMLLGNLGSLKTKCHFLLGMTTAPPRRPTLGRKIPTNY